MSNNTNSSADVFENFNKAFEELSKRLEYDAKRILNSTNIFVEAFKKLSSSEIYANMMSAFSVIRGIFVSIKKILINIFKEFDNSFAYYRQIVGKFASEARSEESNLGQLSVNLMHMGATLMDVISAVQSLKTNFAGIYDSVSGYAGNITSAIVQLNKQFNISSYISANFLKTLAGMSDSTIKSNIAMIGFARKMANVVGMPIVDMMNRVAFATDNVRRFIGDSAVSLIKAVAGAKMLGVELETLANTANGILQFSSSISSELRASALIGKNINLNEARRLAFNRDMIGMGKEILSIAKEANFTEMNIIQQEAFSSAVGMSISAIQNMIQQENILNEIRKNGTDKEKAILHEYEKYQKLKEQEAKDIGILANKEAERLANQARLQQLHDMWAQALRQVIYPLIDLIIPAVDILIKGMSFAVSLLTQFIDYVKIAVTYVAKIEYFYLHLKYIFELMQRIAKLPGLANIIPINTLSKINAFIDSINLQFLKLSSLIIFKPIEYILNSFGLIMKIFNPSMSYLILTISKGLSYIHVILSESFGKTFTTIINTIQTLQKIFFSIGSFIKNSLPTSLLEVIGNVVKILKLQILELFNISKIPSFFSSIFKFASPLLKIFKIISAPLKILPFVGWILIAIELISKMGRVFNAFKIGFTNGIYELGKVLFEAFIGPFVTIGEWFGKLFNWIMSLFGGNSPSLLGKRILIGITSIIEPLKDALTTPFIWAFNIITTVISNFTNYVKQLLSNIIIYVTQELKFYSDIIYQSITNPFLKAFSFIKIIFTNIINYCKNIFSVFANIALTIGNAFASIFSSKQDTAKLVESHNNTNDDNVNTVQQQQSNISTQNNTQNISDQLNNIINITKQIVDLQSQLNELLESGAICISIDGKRFNYELNKIKNSSGIYGQVSTIM